MANKNAPILVIPVYFRKEWQFITILVIQVSFDTSLLTILEINTPMIN